MQRTNLTRVFLSNGVQLADPNPALTVADAVRVLAAAGRPDLATAEIQGPVVKGNRSIYTLHRAVGTKGRLTENTPKVLRRKAKPKAASGGGLYAKRLKAFQADTLIATNPAVAAAVDKLFEPVRPGQSVFVLPGQVLPCLG